MAHLVFRATIVLFIAVLLCASPPARAAELRKVAINFGLLAISPSGAPIFSVPRAMGFWAEEGLDVEVQLANGVGSAVQQLIAGSVAVTIGGLPPTFGLINKGARLVVAQSFSNRNIYYPVALDSSRIKSVADMKGRNIGVTSPSSSNVFFIKAMLQKAGLNPDKDVTLVSVGTGGAAMNALTSGRIDVLQLTEATYDQLERNGHKLRRFDNVQGISDLIFTYGAAVRLETLQSDPELLVRIFRGIAKGIVYARAHPEDAVRMHWKVYPNTRMQGVGDKEALENDVALLHGSLRNSVLIENKKFGDASMESVAAMAEAMKEAGDIDLVLSPDKYFNASLVDKVNNFDHAVIAARPAPK